MRKNQNHHRTAHVDTRLTKKQKAKFREVCQREGLEQSDVISELIHRWLSHHLTNDELLQIYPPRPDPLKGLKI